VLQNLIKEALANNYNMRIAATRILEASANLGITRANQFPTLNGSFGVINQQLEPFYDGAPTFDTASLQLNYIVDFWGQFRRETEAARAALFSTVYARDVVQITLVSLVAQNYFLLRQYDAQLVYSQNTVAADKQILDLNTIRYKGGDAAITDVYQAQVLVQQAEAEAITLQRAIAQSENNLSILLGRNPGPIPRGLSLTAQPHLPEVPAGLPSALLERRPDVRRDEESLVAANANVGVAKAAFFPQIPLTAQFGAESVSPNFSMVQPPSGLWAERSCNPSSKAAGSRAAIAWPGRSATMPSSPTNKPSSTPLATFPIAWSATTTPANIA
jgi:multidrug efflux system outer membrane protein